MSEKSLWQTVKRELATYGVLKRIENSLDKGTPDVAYTIQRASGWIELKHLKAWPARASTTLHVPSLTLEQVLWHETWTRGGGTSWLLIQVNHTYLLCPSIALRPLHERLLTEDDLRKLSVATTHGRLDAGIMARTIGSRR